MAAPGLSFGMWDLWTSQVALSSVHFSHSDVSVSLRPHGPQHPTPLCPSPTPRVHPNSCPSSWWHHPTITPSVIPSSSYLQSFQSFPMSQLFASGGQIIGVSVSTSVLPVDIQDWFPLRIDWFDLLAVQGSLKSLLKHHSSKASFLWYSAFFMVQVSHPYMTTRKTFDYNFEFLEFYSGV